MDQYMKQTADEYLHRVLEDTIRQILESQDDCEVGVALVITGGCGSSDHRLL